MPRRSSVTSVHDNRNISVINSQKPSFSQTVKEGVALGIGSSIGHRMVGFFMGPPHSQTIHSQTVIIKSRKQEEYEQCLKDYNDKAVCERILLN
jgi:hypothetical protein